MNRFVSIGAAAKAPGVSVSTLRRWEAAGRIVPDHTSGGHRRYDLAKFRPELFHAAEAPHRTIAYARVSSNDQKADLERQKQVLELFCATNGWQFEVISDLGSGMNYRKKGQKRLLDEIVDSKVGRLVITHKDRLLRFGAEVVLAICEARNVGLSLIAAKMPRLSKTSRKTSLRLSRYLAPALMAVDRLRTPSLSRL